MYRLAELDADSAGMVRVIDYFDALVRHGADATSLLRASAALADCVVGIETTGKVGSRDVLRCDRRGQWSPLPQLAPTTAKDIVLGDVVAGRVWIERPGEKLPLDDMLVDRMALTAASILQPRRPLTDTEQTRNLLFPVDEFAVLTACAALRIEPSTAVRVLVSTMAGGVRLPMSADPAPGRSTGIEMAGEHLDLVLDSRLRESELYQAAATHSACVGISLAAKASDAHLLVGTARFARSQTSERTPVVYADDLGALVLLTPGPRIDHARIPDIVRALELSKSESGIELLATLRVYLRSGTLRAAADSMHCTTAVWRTGSPSCRIMSGSASMRSRIGRAQWP